MQWNDKAIILSVKRLGESSAVIHCLTREHGLHAGVDKGAFGKRKRGVYQPGNIVAAHWQARLAEQMGMINCELLEPVAARILDDRRKLAALSAAAQMIGKVLHERDAQPEVFARMKALAQALQRDEDWLYAYVMLEFALLEHAGFGLDLARCAATGQEHDLMYVSPKSGRAVSREAGAPYHDRLFKLPGFLSYSPLAGESQSHAEAYRAKADDAVGGKAMRENAPLPPPQGGRGYDGKVDIIHILDGMRLCGYFLHERVFTPRSLTLPSARSRFIGMLADVRC